MERDYKLKLIRDNIQINALNRCWINAGDNLVILGKTIGSGTDIFVMVDEISHYSDDVKKFDNETIANWLVELIIYGLKRTTDFHLIKEFKFKIGFAFSEFRTVNGKKDGIVRDVVYREIVLL